MKKEIYVVYPFVGITFLSLQNIALMTVLKILVFFNYALV